MPLEGRVCCAVARVEEPGLGRGGSSRGSYEAQRSMAQRRGAQAPAQPRVSGFLEECNDMEKLLSPREDASLSNTGQALPVEPQLLSDVEIDSVAGGLLNGLQNFNNNGGLVGIGAIGVVNLSE